MANAILIGNSLDDANKVVQSDTILVNAMKDGKLKFVVTESEDGKPQFYAITRHHPDFDSERSFLTPSQALGHTEGFRVTPNLSPMDRLLDRARIGKNLTHRQRDPLRKNVHSQEADMVRDAMDFVGSYVGPSVAGAVAKTLPGAAAGAALGGLASGIANAAGAHAAGEPEEATEPSTAVGTALGAGAGALWNKHFSKDATVRRHAKKYVEDKKLKGNRVDDKLLDKAIEAVEYGSSPENLPTVQDWQRFPLTEFDELHGEIPMRIDPLPAPRRLPEGSVVYDRDGKPVGAKRFSYGDREPITAFPTRDGNGNVEYDVPPYYIAESDVPYEKFPKMSRERVAKISDAELDAWMGQIGIAPNARNREAVRSFLVHGYGDENSTYGKDLFPSEERGITGHTKSEMVDKWTGKYTDRTEDTFAQRMYRERAHAEDPEQERELTDRKGEYKRRHRTQTASKKTPLVSHKDYEEMQKLKVPLTKDKYVPGRPFVRAAGTFLLPMLVNGAQGYLMKFLGGQPDE